MCGFVSISVAHIRRTFCPLSCFDPFSLCNYHGCSSLASIPMDVDRRQPIRRTESAVDLSPFESVRQGLAENNTVGWQLAPASIELATRVFHTPEAQRFLGDFLHQVTGIMLDQVRFCFVLSPVLSLPRCVRVYVSEGECGSVVVWCERCCFSLCRSPVLLPLLRVFRFSFLTMGLLR